MHSTYGRLKRQLGGERLTAIRAFRAITIIDYVSAKHRSDGSLYLRRVLYNVMDRARVPRAFRNVLPCANNKQHGIRSAHTAFVMTTVSNISRCTVTQSSRMNVGDPVENAVVGKRLLGDNKFLSLVILHNGGVVRWRAALARFYISEKGRVDARVRFNMRPTSCATSDLWKIIVVRVFAAVLNSLRDFTGYVRLLNVFRRRER